MKLKLIGVWAVLLLLPAIPVLVFYAVFDNQNYFHLEDAARGIVATGPIAAYIALVWLGWQIYKRVSSLLDPLTPYEEELLGTSWRFTASSYHGTKRKGSFKVTQASNGDLCFAGTFEDDGGKNVGSWESTLAHCEDGRLQIVYDLDDFGKGDLEQTSGMLSLNADAQDPNRISGNWVVFGRAETNGNMVCEKIG